MDTEKEIKRNNTRVLFSRWLKQKKKETWKTIQHQQQKINKSLLDGMKF